MPSKCGCVVRGCTTTYSNLPAGVSLVTFPNDERRVKWVEAVKGKGSDWVPFKGARICTLHFQAKYFWKNHSSSKKRLLLPGAIPNPAPQLPPASTIISKRLPNSNVYVYRKKKGSSDVQSPVPIDSNSSPQQHQDNILVMRKTPPASSDSLLLPSESRAAYKMVIPLAAPITPHTPASNVCDSLPSTSSTPNGAYSEASPNGTNHNVLPCSPPPSLKRGALAADTLETPSEALVLHLQSGAPVPVCLDIEEDDSPRKVALKKMIAYMDSQLRDEREKREKSAQEIRKLQGKLDQTTRELDAMKDIIKKAIDFDLSCVTIDAPPNWEDRAIIWHARPALLGSMVGERGRADAAAHNSLRQQILSSSRPDSSSQ